ncbi:TetR/AcrR family transcriptional regulator [Colwellia sp. PAMC 20917]|uniref:TetR/AcrR family transcriptional regulator n=1 Tax=Colwellia sp. PAMC 20917 TaxID=1816218 RepID=UPI000AAD408C|nr:TetR/AcrR family transcriptional regulator [Colwellia sp. PAMC 20917]
MNFGIAVFLKKSHHSTSFTLNGYIAITMPTKNVFLPKQQRSQDTQRKLLNALHFCLQDKFFEHITIKELSTRAGVSVGTFYRRFKDKESLLPLLYQDFGNDLSQWVTNLELIEFANLKEAVEKVSVETYQFLSTRKSVFRTLHLNSRLHSELLDSDKSVDRKVIYQRLVEILLRFRQEITAKDQSKVAEVAIFMIISGLLDKVLYPTLTPAIACEIDDAEFSIELPKIILPYLTI